MTTLVRALGFTGAGAVGLAALSFASPASAVTVAGCGDEPVGATLTKTSGVCELDFATAGDFTWLVPTGITSFYAVLVGGGGGGYADGNGYAGSGGEVKYADFSAPYAAAASVTVGAGGATLTAVNPSSEDGGSTIVDFTSSVVAYGGSGTAEFMPNYCLPGGTSFSLVGPGDGAGGAAVNASGGDCSIAYGPSVNPSTDADSDSAPALAVFSSLDTEFGAGGTVEIAPDALPGASDLIGTGNGASVLVAADLSSVASADFAGGSGRVIFRYTTETSADSGGGAGGGSGDGSGGIDESGSGTGTGTATDATTAEALAKTGTDVFAPIALLSALGAAGVAFLALARRRRAAVAVASSTKN
jgi:hypothetical protein